LEEVGVDGRIKLKGVLIKKRVGGRLLDMYLSGREKVSGFYEKLL